MLLYVSKENEPTVYELELMSIIAHGNFYGLALRYSTGESIMDAQTSVVHEIKATNYSVEFITKSGTHYTVVPDSVNLQLVMDLARLIASRNVFIEGFKSNIW